MSHNATDTLATRCTCGYDYESVSVIENMVALAEHIDEMDQNGAITRKG